MIMVIIQLRRIINAYLRRSTKPLQNEILRLSNFRLQNLSNLDAAIQIFLCLHKPNSPIFHSYVTFRLTLNKCLHLNAMISTYRVFSRLHLITNFLSFLPRNDIPQNAFHSRNLELKTTICSHENPRLQINNELRTFCVTRKLKLSKETALSFFVHAIVAFPTLFYLKPKNKSRSKFNLT